MKEFETETYYTALEISDIINIEKSATQLFCSELDGHMIVNGLCKMYHLTRKKYLELIMKDSDMEVNYFNDVFPFRIPKVHNLKGMFKPEIDILSVFNKTINKTTIFKSLLLEPTNESKINGMESNKTLFFLDSAKKLIELVETVDFKILDKETKTEYESIIYDYMELGEPFDSDKLYEEICGNAYLDIEQLQAYIENHFDSFEHQEINHQEIFVYYYKKSDIASKAKSLGLHPNFNIAIKNQSYKDLKGESISYKDYEETEVKIKLDSKDINKINNTNSVDLIIQLIETGNKPSDNHILIKSTLEEYKFQKDKKLPSFKILYSFILEQYQEIDNIKNVSIENIETITGLTISKSKIYNSYRRLKEKLTLNLH